LLALPQTARYQTPGFRPCAVICNICGVTQSLGYVPIYDRGSLKLYGPPSP